MNTQLPQTQPTIFAHQSFLIAVTVIGLLAGLSLNFYSSSLTFAQTTEGQSTPQRFQRSFQLPSGGEVSIENYKGTIKIESWDREEVAVDVYKRFEGSSNIRDRWLDETKVNFDQGTNRVRIKVEYPRHENGVSFNDEGYSGSVELSLRVPRRVNLDLDGYKPEMNIQSITGEIRIKSYKAPIDIRSTTGPIRIDTYKETIIMRDVNIERSLDVKMYKGELDLDINGIGDRATFDTYSANVVVRLPERTRMNLDIDGGKHADIKSDFPVTVMSKTSDDLRGTIDGGGPVFRFKTYKGSLALRRK